MVIAPKYWGREGSHSEAPTLPLPGRPCSLTAALAGELPRDTCGGKVPGEGGGRYLLVSAGSTVSTLLRWPRGVSDLTSGTLSQTSDPRSRRGHLVSGAREMELLGREELETRPASTTTSRGVATILRGGGGLCLCSLIICKSSLTGSLA